MDKEIVIAGISGRFPEAVNVEEFWSNLTNGVDMVTANDRRWPRGYDGLPARRGTLKNTLDEFDADFFNIHRKQADRLDPGLRQLFEVTWEAVFDSGVNPQELRSQPIGVYVGNSSYESIEAARTSLDHVTQYDATGTGGSMFANRLSFAFDFRGPSVTVDTYCSSSLFAMHLATKAILLGECDGAIVAGVNIHVNPLACASMQMVGILSPDGKCKSFDASGDVYAQSEAVTALYITKKTLSKRCYATVLSTATNTDGHKENGFTHPSGDSQALLMRRTYEEAGILPEDVYYVEAHGTGTAAGDVQELQAITSVFCQNRTIAAGPLLIGSVKSNMGHAEAASGLCSVIKVLLCIQHGQIPPNLHYVTPNPAVPALVDGRLQVIDRHTNIEGKLFGVCSSGVGGVNVHAILRGQRPLRQLSRIHKLPLFVPFSARTSQGIEPFQKKVEDLDLEAVLLLSKIHELPLANHNFRSCVVFDADQKTSIFQTVETKRPLWVIFPGMGTQWAGMGRDILLIDPIRESLEISASILKPFDFDLIDLITNQDEEGLRPFGQVALAAIGIALVDFLKSLDMSPEGYIGHSTGDLLCAYFDGCWTQEEVLLCQYHKASLLSKLKGNCAMASVGLTWDEAMSQSPKGIYPACHNAEDNVTVSGSAVELGKFVQELKSRGTFAKMVPSGGMGYHSPHISHLATQLQPLIKEIINDPRPKSSKWISTAIDEDPLDKTEGYFTAEYILHQFVSPVRFHNAVEKIPSNAIILELGSHSLFQNILKRSLPSGVTLIPTMQRHADDNVGRLYNAVATLFVHGFQPKLSAIWPHLEDRDSLLPNSKCSLSSLVQWDHSKKYMLFDFVQKGKAQHVTKVSLLEKEWAYLIGHKIDGRILFPATGYLVLVWKAFASLLKKPWRSLGVKFDNVTFHRATVLKAENIVDFAVNILESNGSFEILESGMLVSSGKVHTSENNNQTFENFTSSDAVLKSEEVYKDFRVRGYEYTGDFQGILSSSLLGDSATVQWCQEWITLLDTILQIGILSLPISSSGIYLPTSITSLEINPGIFENFKTPGSLPLYFCSKTNSVSTSGVHINDIRFSSVPRRKRDEVHPSILSWAFVPYMDTDSKGTLPFYDVLKVLVDIVLENTTTATSVRVKELYAEDGESSMIHKVAEIITLAPGREVSKTATKAHLLIAQTLTNLGDFQNTDYTLDENGFVLIILKTFISEFEILKSMSHNFGLLSLTASKVSEKEFFYLLRKATLNLCSETIIPVSNTNYDWIEPLQEAISKESLTSRIWLTSNDPHSGLVGFVNCLRKEGIFSVRCLISPHPEVTEEMKHSDLVMNVFNDGKLCSYRGFSLPEISKVSSAHAYLNVLEKGDLKSAAWIEAPVLESCSNQLKICVKYAALNSRDVLLATGKLSQDTLPELIRQDDCVLGMEFSGIDPRGNRVMGIVPSKGLSTHLLCDPSLTWKVPDQWTMAEASTVPMAYATAYYALIMRANIQRGESVLITSGSGGVGQAAIEIALNLSCKIYTTVGSKEKKIWLAKKFPQIAADNILSSQNTGFANEILKFTKQRGVEVVLNSLAEEKLKAAFSVVAIGGRFLEIGKFDLSQNIQFGVEMFLKNISFHGIFIDTLFSDSEQIIAQKQELKNLVSEGIHSGVVRPLPVTIFESVQAREAFRFISSKNHMGKIVLRICGDDAISPLLKVIPCTYFDSHKMYVLVGGLGGFGLAITAWLISRGARNVALIERSGVTSGYQQLQISRWRKAGVNVLVSKANLKDSKDCESFLQECESMATVGGIFNLAMVLKDGIFENQNAENFQIVITPKYVLTQNLDQASRRLCPNLDHFVAFSSGTANYGTAGQSNYGFGNSAMERIIVQRRADGFPALLIAFGPVDEVGYVQEFKGEIAGIRVALRQPLKSCLKLLDNLLHPTFQNDSAQVSTIVLATKDEGECVSQKESMVISLTQKIAEMLCISMAEFESKKDLSVGELGLDSLMFMEAKHILAEYGKVGLTAAQIRNLTWFDIQEYEKARA